MIYSLGRSAGALLGRCLVLAVMLSLTACGGDDSEPQALAFQPQTQSSTTPTTHRVSGSVEGVTADGLILRLNQANDLAIPANASSFEFTTQIAHNETYQVTIRVEPAELLCGIANATGTAAADVTNIRVTCAPPKTYKILAGAGPGGSISPSGTVAVVAGESIEFVATPNPGYVVDKWILNGGSGSSSPFETKARFYNVSEDQGVLVTFRPAVLMANVRNLALSVNDVATNAALTGNARNIVIKNISSTTTATNLSVSAPSLPAGTAVSSSTCGPSLAPGATCSITITPGSTATSSCTTGYAAIPDKITVSANEDVPLSLGVVVLGYGCIYQAGYVFAIDDTTPLTASVGAKALATTDQVSAYPNGVVWASNGSGFTSSYVDYQLVGVGRNSTSPCVGAEDGECNSTTILTHYPPRLYRRELFAAGLCERKNKVGYGGSGASTGGQWNWYLPSHCEANVCGPGQQSIQANLVDYHNLNLLSGRYWTSTESADTPTTDAFAAMFAPGSVVSSASNKNEQAGVRCIRKLTD